MKITVYTIKACIFSKQEKDYLDINKLQYEEKDLEQNKEYLTEMITISNNFSATPVTQIKKDDGSITVLKGFKKEKFDITFGFATTPTSTELPLDPLKSVMDNLQSKFQPTNQLIPPPTPGLLADEETPE